MGLRSALLPLAAAWCFAAPALAQPAAEPRVEPPPAPDALDAELNVAIRLGAIFPFESADICPGDAFCVLGSGASVGVEIERRWPIGIGILVAYDAWFVDSGGVFELGLAQLVRAGMRYTFLLEQIVHPSLHVGAGALIFGDTFLVETVGGAFDVGASAEIELSDSVVLTGGLSFWMFTTSPFTTGRDRTRRSEGAGLNLAVSAHVGLTILADSGGR
ncbi:MAG: hypothetical protein KF729_18745 [Sandaracinaceae bacterium]|nr:hypothetical protein [Sandaracinaceae bacterium]